MYIYIYIYIYICICKGTRSANASKMGVMIHGSELLLSLPPSLSLAPSLSLPVCEDTRAASCLAPRLATGGLQRS